MTIKFYLREDADCSTLLKCHNPEDQHLYVHHVMQFKGLVLRSSVYFRTVTYRQQELWSINEESPSV